MKNKASNLRYTEKDGIQFPILQISNDPLADQPLGRYGRMALEYLRDTDFDRYTVLKMDGTLMEVMHQVQETVTAKIEILIQQMLVANPLPHTEDTLKRTRHLNGLKLTAEEIVIREIVLKSR